MSKLGYTWYPKDWGNSDAVFELLLDERGMFRELIDMAMLNDNKTEIKTSLWCRKFAVNNEDLERILITLEEKGLIILDKSKDILFVPSCEKRLTLVRAGSKGGKKSKPTSKPLGKPSGKPDSNQIEKKEKGKEKKEESFIMIQSILEEKETLNALLKVLNISKIKVTNYFNEFSIQYLTDKFTPEEYKDKLTHFINYVKKQEKDIQKENEPERGVNGRYIGQAPTPLN